MKKEGIGRRDFLKIGTAAAVVGAAIISSKAKGAIFVWNSMGYQFHFRG